MKRESQAFKINDELVASEVKSVKRLALKPDYLVVS